MAASSAAPWHHRADLKQLRQADRHREGPEIQKAKSSGSEHRQSTRGEAVLHIASELVGV